MKEPTAQKTISYYQPSDTEIKKLSTRCFESIIRCFVHTVIGLLIWKMRKKL